MPSRSSNVSRQIIAVPVAALSRSSSTQLTNQFILSLQRASGAQVPRSKQINSRSMRSTQSGRTMNYFCKPVSKFSSEKLTEFDRINHKEIEKIIDIPNWGNNLNYSSTKEALNTLRVLLLQSIGHTSFINEAAKIHLSTFLGTDGRNIKSLLTPLIIEPEGSEMGEAVVVSTIAMFAYCAKSGSQNERRFWLNLLDMTMDVLEQDELMGTDFLGQNEQNLIINRHPSSKIAYQLSGHPNFSIVLEAIYQDVTNQTNELDFLSNQEPFLKLICELMPRDNIYDAIVENKPLVLHLLDQFNKQNTLKSYFDSNTYEREDMLNKYRANPFAFMSQTSYQALSENLKHFIEALFGDMGSDKGGYSKHVVEAFFLLLNQEPDLLSDSDLLSRCSQVLSSCNRDEIVDAFIDDLDLQQLLLKNDNVFENLMNIRLKGGRLSNLLFSTRSIERMQKGSKESLNNIRAIVIKTLSLGKINTFSLHALFDLIKSRSSLPNEPSGQRLIGFLTAGLSKSELQEWDAGLQKLNAITNRYTLTDMVAKIDAALKEDKALPVHWEQYPNLSLEQLQITPLCKSIESKKALTNITKNNIHALMKHFPNLAMHEIGSVSFIELLNQCRPGKKGGGLLESLNASFKREFDGSQQQIKVLDSVLVTACQNRDWNTFKTFVPLINEAEHSDFALHPNPVLNVLSVAQDRLNTIDNKRLPDGEAKVEKQLLLSDIRPVLKSLLQNTRSCWGLTPGEDDEPIRKILKNDMLWNDPDLHPLQKLCGCFRGVVIEQLSKELLRKQYNDLFMGLSIKTGEHYAQAVFNLHQGLEVLFGISADQLLQHSESQFEFEPFLNYVSLKQKQGSPINLNTVFENSVALSSRSSTLLSKIIKTVCDLGKIEIAERVFRNACERRDTDSMIELCNDGDFHEKMSEYNPGFNSIKLALFSLHDDVANQRVTLDQAKEMAYTLLHGCQNQEILKSFYLNESLPEEQNNLRLVARAFGEELNEVQRLHGLMLN